MALTKKQRKEVWDKTNGHCAYCGVELLAKGWHADHIIPVVRNWDGSMAHPHLDTIENMLPACASCNNYKHTFSLEQFRWSIAQQVTRARKTSANFRFAERFGRIQITDNEPVVFYYETLRSTNG